MSLRVWLPLNGTLDNLGLSELKPVQTTSPSWVTGKIGSMAMSTGAFYLPAAEVSKFYNNDAMSFAFWIYPKGSGSSPIIGQSTMTKGDNRMFTIYQYPNPDDLHYSWQSNESSSAFFSTTHPDALTMNAWNHVVVVYDGSALKVKTYINGVLTYTEDCTKSPRTNFEYNVPIPSASTRYLNDVRIYNTVLSDKEIRDISKALVLHYPLNDRYIGNLIANGNGSLGNYNWDKSPDTTNIPSVAGIVGSFTDATSSEYIPFDYSHTYSISMYLKRIGETTSSTYPSFLPYDHDKLFINNYNCAFGFSNATVTTLSQALNPGDTVIHATDLSNWIVDTTSHYYYVAVFGYKNSDGFVYPDLEYTQDSIRFGTQTDKSHINKTNNTITLNSAFTGKARPAGTTICQACAGNSYYYPFAGISYSAITNWTLKSTTFVYGTSYNYQRLRWAEYIRFYAYTNAYYAGIEVKDLTLETDIIYDASGYHNNGQLFNKAQTIQNTSRYDLGIQFYDPDVSTYSTNTGAYIRGSLSMTGHEAITICWWGNHTKGYGGNWQGLLSTSNNEEAPIDYTNQTVNQYDQKFQTSNASGTYVTPSANTIIVANEWHHYAMVYNGANVIWYRDGVQMTTNALTGALASFTYVYINVSKAGGAWRGNNTKMSDFRIYATSLSSSDVKELYNVGASVDNQYDIHTYDYIEDEYSDNPSIYKSGIVKASAFVENFSEHTLKDLYDTVYYTEPDGSKWIRIFHHNNPASKLFSSTNNFIDRVYIDADRWFDISICNYVSRWELMVKQKLASTSTETKYRWIQFVNPMIGTFDETKAANVIKITTSGYTNVSNAGGIIKGNSSNTYMTINNGTAGNWYGAIGCWTAYNGGIPGYPNTTVNTGYMDLYLRIDDPGIYKEFISGNELIEI